MDRSTDTILKRYKFILFKCLPEVWIVQNYRFKILNPKLIVIYLTSRSCRIKFDMSPKNSCVFMLSEFVFFFSLIQYIECQKKIRLNEGHDNMEFKALAKYYM